MLDDLALFVSIVDSGSLSAAARRAQLPPATVTRRLQQLERVLGCRLLHRSARRLQPTPEGLAYYERCRPILASLQQATQNLDATLHRVAGLVRVLAPVNLAVGVLALVWGEFLSRYPEVQIDLHLSNLRDDVFAHGADLAIRVGDQPDSSLGQRGLGHAATVLVAAPAYLAQRAPIDHPSDLAAHDWLVAEPLSRLTLQHPASGESCALHPGAAPRLHVNELDLAVQLACDGLGLLFVPLIQCHAALQSGALTRVLPDWRTPMRPISVVWPAQRQLPARVRTLVDLLASHAERQPLLNPVVSVNGKLKEKRR